MSQISFEVDEVPGGCWSCAQLQFAGGASELGTVITLCWWIG